MDQDAAKGSPAVLSTTEANQAFDMVSGKPPVEQIEGTPEDLHNRGIRLINEGKAEEALPALRRAVELTPQNPDHHHNLGVALAHLGRLDEAVTSFREALRIKPEGTSALSNLGL